MKPWHVHAIQLYSVALLDLASTWAALHVHGTNVQGVEANPIMSKLGFWGTAGMKIGVFTAVVFCLPRMTPTVEKVVARFGIFLTGAVVLSNALQLGVFIDPLYAAVGVGLVAWAWFWPLLGQRATEPNHAAHEGADN